MTASAIQSSMSTSWNSTRRGDTEFAHALVEFADPTVGAEPVVDNRSRLVTTDAGLVGRVEMDQAQQLIGIDDGLRLGFLCRVTDGLPPHRCGLLHVEDPTSPRTMNPEVSMSSSNTC